MEDVEDLRRGELDEWGLEQSKKGINWRIQGEQEKLEKREEMGETIEATTIEAFPSNKDQQKHCGTLSINFGQLHGNVHDAFRRKWTKPSNAPSSSSSSPAFLSRRVPSTKNTCTFPHRTRFSATWCLCRGRKKRKEIIFSISMSRPRLQIRRSCPSGTTPPQPPPLQSKMQNGKDIHSTGASPPS